VADDDDDDDASAPAPGTPPSSRTPSSSPLPSWSEARWLDGLAGLAWVGVFAGVAALGIAREIDTYAIDVYGRAAEAWWAREDLYAQRAERGFQYLPTAALLFAPFAALGPVAGGLLWRGVGLALYAGGVVGLARRVAPERPRGATALATAVALGPAIGSLGNGQANLHVAGLALLAALALGTGRPAVGGVALVLGVATKPIALPHLMLAGATDRRRGLWAGLLVAGTLAVASPLAFAPAEWLGDQLLGMAAKLRDAARPKDRYENLAGLWAAATGQAWPPALVGPVQLLGAAATLVGSGLARRRLEEPVASVVVAALGWSWVLLLSPQTQPTYFVLAAGPAAVLAAWRLGAGRPREALAWALLTVPWTASHKVLPFIEHWLRPLATLVFVAALVALLRPDETDQPRTRVATSTTSRFRVGGRW
jgi:hypothetical protein